MNGSVLVDSRSTVSGFGFAVGTGIGVPSWESVPRDDFVVAVLNVWNLTLHERSTRPFSARML